MSGGHIGVAAIGVQRQFSVSASNCNTYIGRLAIDLTYNQRVIGDGVRIVCQHTVRCIRRNRLAARSGAAVSETVIENSVTRPMLSNSRTTSQSRSCRLGTKKWRKRLSYCAGGCTGLGGTWTAFGAGGAKAKIF
jgi:hypothetical protein